jgi:hypothetical protein
MSNLILWLSDSYGVDLVFKYMQLGEQFNLVLSRSSIREFFDVVMIYPIEHFSSFLHCMYLTFFSKSKGQVISDVMCHTQVM